jgi:hypothetical protein
MSVTELALYDPRVPAYDQVSLMVDVNMQWDVTTAVRAVFRGRIAGHV